MTRPVMTRPMKNTAVKVGGFALGLLAVFGASVGIGSAVSTVTPAAAAGTEAADPGHGEDMASDDMGSGNASHGDAVPGGLMVSQDGYSLDIDARSVPAGDNVAFRFRILDNEGHPVTKYDIQHDKQLHLIVVRRDLADFQHVHPVLDGAGEWSVPLDLPDAGEYRVFADFTPAGHDRITLGADISVPGRYQPQALPAPAATAQLADGYAVTLAGGLVANASSELTLTVTKDGKPVTDLEPYLAAYGHLVALRVGDLAYLHVHPEGEPGDGVTPSGPGITFAATAPSAGKYRLYLDFQHQGTVRTAMFTVLAAPAG